MSKNLNKLASVFLVLSIMMANYSVFVFGVSALEIVDVPSMISKQITKRKIRNYFDHSKNVKSSKSNAHLDLNLEYPDFTGNYEATSHCFEEMNTCIENDASWETCDSNYDSCVSQNSSSTNVTMSSDFIMDTGSVVNLLDDENPMFQVQYSVQGSYDEEAMNFNAEMRFVNDVFYGFVNDIPDEMVSEEPRLAQIEGKWFSYSSPEIVEFRKALTTLSNGDVSSQISDENLDMLIEFIHSNEFNKHVSQRTVTSEDGVVADCVKYKWSNTELKNLIVKAAKVFGGETITTSDMGEVTFGNTEFELCMKPDLTKVYGTSLKMSVSSNEDFSLDINFQQTSSHFNHNLLVEAPGGATPLVDVFPEEINEINSEVDSSMGMYGLDELETCNNIGGNAFPDVADSFETADAITYAKNNGIVNGFSDGCYHPGREVTREQFIKIITRSQFDGDAIDGCNNMPFPDVAEDNKFKHEICYAAEKGIIGGYEDGTFRGAQGITFGESSKVIANAYGITSEEPVQTDNKFESFMVGLESRKAIPSSVSCYDYKVRRGEITEVIYRVDASISNKESMSLDEVISCQ